MSTITNDHQEFQFYNVPSGEYFILYNPFPIANSNSYWQYWDGRALDFASGNSLANSLGQTEVVVGLSGPSGNFVVQLTQYPMVIELLRQQGTPPMISVTSGQISRIEITAYAFPLH